jgi:Fur family transcriptional regulator, ferric uptake regulator
MILNCGRLRCVLSELHPLAAERLRADDQRYTPGRRAVVEILHDAEQPLTIPQLLERRRDLPQSSVYRNLAVLERVGIVHRIVTTDEFARYELAEDLTEHHHHLICSGCGDLQDFTVPIKLETELDNAAARVAKKTGFLVDQHRLDLVGLCPACRTHAAG